MVRTDLLRSKSIQAEISYLRDVKKVGEMKKEERAIGVVRQARERSFWREAVRATGPSDARGAPVSARTADSLERLRLAHGALRDARAKHGAAHHRLAQGLRDVAHGSKRLEILESLLAKAKRVRASRCEARASEELSELSATARLLRHTKGDTGNVKAGARLAHVEREQTGRERCSDQCVAAAPVANAVSPIVTETVQRVCSERGEVASVTPSVHVHQVACAADQGGTQLAIRSSLGSHGAVSLSIVKREGEGLRVVIDPAASSIAGAISRDKGLIQSKLGQLGVRVESIEVGSGDSTDAQSYGLRRSRRRLGEDEDEELLA